MDYSINKKIGQKFILILILLFLLTCCKANNGIEYPSISTDSQKNQEDTRIYQYLYPIELNGKWGYIDKSGKIKIQPIFTKAEQFKENRAAVKIDGLYGFISPDGEIIIKPEFDEVLNFNNNVAKVRVKDKWMYINSDGELLTGLEKFNNISDFSEGLASASITGNVKYGFIDRKGNPAIEFNFSEAGAFRNGLAPVSIMERGFFYYNFLFRWFYINRNGKQAFAFDSYTPLSEFSDGLAAIPYFIFWKKSYGYTNKDGQVVIKPQFDEAYPFSEGIATIRMNGQLYIIDKNGRIIAKSPSTKPVYFSEGFAIVDIKGKFGYINKEGEIIIKPTFDFADNFYGGVAQVKISSNVGYINVKGEYIWNHSEKLNSHF